MSFSFQCISLSLDNRVFSKNTPIPCPGPFTRHRCAGSVESNLNRAQVKARYIYGFWSLIQEYFTQIGVTISGRVLFFSAIQDNLCAIVISPLKDIPNATEYDDCLTFLPGLSPTFKIHYNEISFPVCLFFKNKTKYFTNFCRARGGMYPSLNLFIKKKNNLAMK